MFQLQIWSIRRTFQDNIATINFRLANVDLLKVSVFIFFDKIYLPKPTFVTIENISSNKT